MQKRPTGRPNPLSPSRRNRYQTLIFDADRFFAAKDYETAFLIYQQALQEAPAGENYPYTRLCRCYRHRARRFFKKQDWPALIQILEEMLQVNGSRPNLKGLDFRILAEAYLESGHLEKAAQALQQALALNPELAPEIKRLQHRLEAEKLHQNFRQLF